jgi:flagellar biosynthesis protein FliQ
MKTLKNYLKGGMIGMITEYGFRVEFTYLQGIILVALVIGMIVDIFTSAE